MAWHIRAILWLIMLGNPQSPSPSQSQFDRNQLKFAWLMATIVFEIPMRGPTFIFYRLQNNINLQLDQKMLLTHGKFKMNFGFFVFEFLSLSLRSSGFTVNLGQLKTMANKWQIAVCAKKGRYTQWSTQGGQQRGIVQLTNCWIDKRNNGQQSAAITVARRITTAMAEITQQQQQQCLTWQRGQRAQCNVD